MSIFLIIIVALIAAVVFFHYLQGFFGASISAILALLSALMAFSYFEVVVDLLNRGGFAPYAQAVALVGLFALVYLILRMAFDKMIPGNVRLPVIVDKIGAALMGVIAAFAGAGVITIAAQTLPFGPSIAGYSRYEVVSLRQVMVNPPAGSYGTQIIDADVIDELKGDGFEEENLQTLWLPVDDLLLSAVRYLSDQGSLKGSQRLGDVHPDYLQELFAQRLGIQIGASRVALNLTQGKRNDVQVKDAFHIDQLEQRDFEMKGIRSQSKTFQPLQSRAGKWIIVIRTLVDFSAADDKDGLFRFSTGSIRLAGNGKDYYPLGTLKGQVLYWNKPDDFLFLSYQDESGKPRERGMDLVFYVDAGDIVTDKSLNNPKEAHFADKVFIEVKRFARVDLGQWSQPIQKVTAIPDFPENGVMRKIADSAQPPMPPPLEPAPTPTSPLKQAVDPEGRMPGGNLNPMANPKVQ